MLGFDHQNKNHLLSQPAPDPPRYNAWWQATGYGGTVYGEDPGLQYSAPPAPSHTSCQASSDALVSQSGKGTCFGLVLIPSLPPRLAGYQRYTKALPGISSIACSSPMQCVAVGAASPGGTSTIVKTADGGISWTKARLRLRPHPAPPPRRTAPALAPAATGIAHASWPIPAPRDTQISFTAHANFSFRGYTQAADNLPHADLNQARSRRARSRAWRRRSGKGPVWVKGVS